MNNDLVSVIVPIYKTEKYLSKCIESILSQEYKNLELILVDDGSPDNSPAICDKYAKIDNRVKVVHKQNGGVCSARNAGINKSNGKYIAFIDSDDTVGNEFSEFITRSIKNDCDFSFSSFADVIYTQEEIYKPLTGDILVDLIKNKIPISSCNKLIKRDLVIENKLYFGEGPNAEDLEWNTRLFFCAKNCCCLPIEYYNYITSETSSHVSYKYKNAVSFINNLSKVYINTDNSSLTKKQKKYVKSNFEDIYFYLIKHYYQFEESDRKKLLVLLKNNKKLVIKPARNDLKLAWIFIKIFGLKFTIFLVSKLLKQN